MMLRVIRLICVSIGGGVFIPLTLKGNACAVEVDKKYRLISIIIDSTAAIDTLPAKPFPRLSLIKKLAPTTKKSLIHRHIKLKPGAIFSNKELWLIKHRLTTLPYFSTVSVKTEIVHPGEIPEVNLIIVTKDNFPITIDMNWDEGALCTVNYQRTRDYGHQISNLLFLKKRWGYGLVYAIPTLKGGYRLGGNCYGQTSRDEVDKDLYTFAYQDIWFEKLFTIARKEVGQIPWYWVVACTTSHKIFLECPDLTVANNTHYSDHTLILGKLAVIADGYAEKNGFYSIQHPQKLSRGGSLELLLGYQYGSAKNRPYIALQCIKNSIGHLWGYLSVGCSVGTFLYKQKLEESVLKWQTAYRTLPLSGKSHGIRPFIDINYIGGFQMSAVKRLAIQQRDPEELTGPSKEELNGISEPIFARLRVHMGSTLHKPIPIHLPFLSFQLVLLGFVDLIGLYNKNHALLNNTLIDKYGIGIQLEHAKLPWPTLTLYLAHSPLWGKFSPAIALSIAPFNHAWIKPQVISYS